jgi:extracellular elastinolytic metalloproteinase
VRKAFRTTRRNTAIFLTVAVVASLTAGIAPAGADPKTTPAKSDFLGEGHGARDKDNRAGMAQPNSRQRALARDAGAVRWNAFGTPEALSPARGSVKPLATGLSADPATAARQYLVQNRDLFGVDEATVAAMEVLYVRPIGSGSVVLLRQRFGNLTAGHDGLVSVLVTAGKVVRVTSSLSRDTRAAEASTLTAEAAFGAALRDAGLTAAQVQPASVVEVAVPMPGDRARAAYAVTLIQKAATDDPAAYTTYIDGRTGDVLIREDLVDFDTDNPTWAVFPSTPPINLGPGIDPRVKWCFEPTRGCVRAVRDPNSGQAWDVDLATGMPTFTSSGNAANNVVLWGGTAPPVPATPRADRNYTYPFTDQWHQSRCNPSVFTSAQRNDADAAVANLFAMHNRMHDWSWHLGFTEATWNMQAVNLSPDGLGGDAEQGRAQAGALTGSRNNANQGTGRDGLPPVTNMFLWQPVAGGAYPPCVDGDYDMTVIGHEYGHAISNRMIAGPDAGIGSAQGGAMGESWSDLMAAEYLFEHGFRAPGDSPFVTGAYVTGNTTSGIRNYDGSKSPLNYSDVGYDLVGQQVHADGEIWTATNLRIRAEMVKRYGSGTPSLQERCANGQVSADACPGNRRWIQLVFDSYLLQASSQFSMIDMRDNMLAADLVRFGGANQDLLWNVFAERGMGQDAVSGPDDADPTPSFASPYANNATVTLRALGDAAGGTIRLYVGDYEARAMPVADTDPETDLPDTFQILPNTQFSFTANGPGFGHRKFTTLFLPGRSQELRLNLPRNLASSISGATFSGDGVNLDRIGDDTESTNWASLSGPVAGKAVTVDLAGDRAQVINTVNVSTLLRPQITTDADPGPQNRFSALRSFAILTCDATVADCSVASNFRQVLRSASDAFPAGNFRPTASQLNLRTFHFAPTRATHVRVVVLNSQCTGNPRYAGEQDNDPAAATDCTANSPFAQHVRISELQVFTR